ncbi:hypothetical protein GCM10022212_32080 [Actimicrobium antarcticum]|uniref:Uncharacterized protein n=2 Tax=Actimicrobium antarcticum TaxID=1051899 RepID=A0ABP7TTQ2_9BURK
MKTLYVIPTLLMSILSVSAYAQNVTPEATPATSVQRDINQQTRIENGLKSGQLTTREAAVLERKESRIDRAQANVLKDGTITTQEKARIQRMQNNVSRDIRAEKHDAQIGNSASASSQRMQQDVQRNINQEQRVLNGLKDGSLTNREAAHLERGQAADARKQARAGSDGHVSATEHARIQRSENRQSQKIHHQRHGEQVKS